MNTDFDPSPHPFPSDQVPGGICRHCQLPGWHSIHQPLAPDRGNHYDDFVASDILKALVANPHGYVRLNDNDMRLWITIDGSLVLTPEQYSVLSALIPPDRGGTAPIPSNPDQE